MDEPLASVTAEGLTEALGRGGGALASALPNDTPHVTPRVTALDHTPKRGGLDLE
jgi:hypothetical protein